MLIDMRKIQVIALADLEKAGFKHGYFTGLVPKEIVTKDGVRRIYWVKPDVGKKSKLTRIIHHREGAEGDHHKDLQKDHEIDLTHVMRFSEGDKVVITWGAEKGREGVFRSSLAGSSPRVSVAFLNPRNGKYEAKTMNINHLGFKGRADDETKKVIERKTVEVTNLKGETILVDRGDYEQYYKDKERRKSPKEKVEEQASKLEVAATYRRPDGRLLHIKYMKRSGGVDEYTVKLQYPGGKRKPREKPVREESLQATIINQGYKRVPTPMIHKGALDYDDAAGKWVKHVLNKPLSAELELGNLHAKGHFAYNDKGIRVATEADLVLARQILAEHWPSLEKIVSTRVAKYGIDVGEVTAADIIDPLTAAVASYEPLLDKGKGVAARLTDYADAYARNEAEKIHEREMSTVRDDFEDDRGSAVSPISAVDKAVIEDMAGDPNDMIASAFVSKQDEIFLREGLDDEADMMSWLYGDEKILDIMKRWTGLGVFESTLTKKEAAAELHGLAYNPATDEPYALSTIETYLLPKELERIIEAFQLEGKGYPEFLNTLKTDVKLRNKIQRNRKILPVDPKDEKIIKVVKEDVKKPDARAQFAAELIKLGVPVKGVPAVMQLGDRILSGQTVLPKEYHKMLPAEFWESGGKALTAWFKMKLPPSVFHGKRAAKFNLPQRFDVQTPLVAAIKDAEEQEFRRQLATAKELDKLGRSKDIPESFIKEFERRAAAGALTSA